MLSFDHSIDMNSLKREAKKLRKSSNITHSRALDIIAARYGFANWSQLARAPKSLVTSTSLLPVCADHSLMHAASLGASEYGAACINFISQIGEHDVERLCFGGSLWIYAVDVLSGDVSNASFVALGPRYDGAIQQFASQMDLILAVCFDGFSYWYVLPDAVDDDGVPVVPEDEEVFYSVDVGRADLLACIESSWEADYDGITGQIESRSYRLELAMRED